MSTTSPSSESPVFLRRLRRVKRQHLLVRRGLIYSLVLAFAILILGGAGFWMLDPKVNSFHEGFWLAFTTAATVGYGDMVPSTPISRAFSVVVVLLGLAVLSLVTASLSAIFVEQDVEAEEKQIELDTLRELVEMRHELQVIRAMVERGHGASRGPVYAQERTVLDAPKNESPLPQELRPTGLPVEG